MLALSAAMLVLGAAATRAHHSQAMYAAGKEITVPGVVVRFIWKNPHSWVHLESQEQGRVDSWEFEALSPNSMTRAGWRRDTIKVGDKVTVIGNPHREGKKQARLLRVIMPDGRVILPGQDPAYAKPGAGR